MGAIDLCDRVSIIVTGFVFAGSRIAGLPVEVEAPTTAQLA